MIDWIKKVDNDDELYLEYLNQAMFTNGIDNKFINHDNLSAIFNVIFSDKNTHFAIKGNVMYRKVLRYLIKKFTKTLNSLQKK